MAGRERNKAAIFWDGENQTDLTDSALMQALAEYEVVEKHVYADLRLHSLASFSRSLAEHGFEVHHVESGDRPGAKKNCSDGAMARAIGCVRRRRPDIGAYVIVSGDVFFLPSVVQLQREGRRVIVVADPFRANRQLATAADEYLPVGQWGSLVSDLYLLERESDYLTFTFVADKLKIGSGILVKMIRKGLVKQQRVHRPVRGVRRELCLNRQNPAVAVVLGAQSRGTSTVARAA